MHFSSSFHEVLAKLILIELIEIIHMKDIDISSRSSINYFLSKDRLTRSIHSKASLSSYYTFRKTIILDSIFRSQLSNVSIFILLMLQLTNMLDIFILFRILSSLFCNSIYHINGIYSSRMIRSNLFNRKILHRHIKISLDIRSIS